MWWFRNSLLLHPDMLLHGKRTTNRLKLIAEWIDKGGGFLMVRHRAALATQGFSDWKDYPRFWQQAFAWLAKR